MPFSHLLAIAGITCIVFSVIFHPFLENLCVVFSRIKNRNDENGTEKH